MEIAEQLAIGLKAVASRVTNLDEKLQVEWRTQAVAWFCEHGPDRLFGQLRVSNPVLI
ncbi:MAG: hypothetical protein ACOYYS_04600 [Chloroflexota bacterium]